MDPIQYNKDRQLTQEFTPDHVETLVRHFQSLTGLEVDGKFGPMTRAVTEDLLTIDTGWLVGHGVEIVPSHPSWFGGTMIGPIGVMAHYTATNPGTAHSMARRRMAPRKADDRAANWHVTVTHEGRLIQQVNFGGQGWHCRKGEVTDRHGQQWSINQSVVGIELEGNGDIFTPEQVRAATRLWVCLVRHYKIRHDLRMLQHSEYDPGRRRDPGPVWMSRHAPGVLAACPHLVSAQAEPGGSFAGS